MSWDICIQNIPESATCVDEIPDDFRPSPLGPRSQVIADILRVIPEVDFSDPSWGMLDHPSFSIEFNMGPDGLCKSFMLHVRGGGDAMRLIDQLLSSLRLRGFDCQSGDFFRLDEEGGTFQQWQDFRDRVISDSSSQT